MQPHCYIDSVAHGSASPVKDFSSVPVRHVSIMDLDAANAEELFGAV